MKVELGGEEFDHLLTHAPCSRCSCDSLEPSRSANRWDGLPWLTVLIASRRRSRESSGGIVMPPTISPASVIPLAEVVSDVRVLDRPKKCHCQQEAVPRGVGQLVLAHDLAVEIYLQGTTVDRSWIAKRREATPAQEEPVNSP